MNVPSKGETVTVEGYGTGLFVKGPNPENETPEIWIKFESWSDGDEIVSIPWGEFKRNRVHPEQQPKPDSVTDWGDWDEMVEKFAVWLEKRNEE